MVFRWYYTARSCPLRCVASSDTTPTTAVDGTSGSFEGRLSIVQQIRFAVGPVVGKHDNNNNKKTQRDPFLPQNNPCQMHLTSLIQHGGPGPAYSFLILCCFAGSMDSRKSHAIVNHTSADQINRLTSISRLVDSCGFPVALGEISPFV